MRSRAVRDATGHVRLALNVPVLAGPGDLTPQHLAFGCDDALRLARAVRDRGVQPLRIPDNYYDDLAARLDLEDELLLALKSVPTPHDAADALAVAITRRKVNHILDADIRDFFGSVNHDWLIRFLEHRIGDKRIIRLIRKWLKAGILEDGIVSVAESGTGQGSVISPLLANVYLHYVFDLWAERWRHREAVP